MDGFFNFLKTLWQEPGVAALMKKVAAGGFGLSFIVHVWNYAYGNLSARSTYRDLKKAIKFAARGIELGPNDAVHMREIRMRFNRVKAAMRTADLNVEYVKKYRSSANMTRWALLVDIGNAFLSQIRLLDSTQDPSDFQFATREYYEAYLSIHQSYEDFLKHN